MRKIGLCHTAIILSIRKLGKNICVNYKKRIVIQLICTYSIQNNFLERRISKAQNILQLSNKLNTL